MRQRLLFAVIIVVVVVTSTVIVSREFRVGKIPNGEAFSCGNCHVNPGGGGSLNGFGLAVNSRVTPNGNQNFWNQSLASLDSDGDGFSNGVELQNPTGSWIVGTPNPGDPTKVTNPGDPFSKPTSTSVDDENLPFQYKLYDNYPNPFNPSTKIVFEIPQSENVTLQIFNISGQLVRTLMNENASAGRYEKLWDGKDNFGNFVTSGIYFYQLNAGQFNKSAKMVMMK